jgi:hypothetical protein
VERLLAGLCLISLGATVLGTSLLAVRGIRRRHSLRRASVDPTGIRRDEWSPEAIDAILVAVDPSQVGPGHGDTSPYAAVAVAIFEGLPQCQRGDRETFDGLLRQSVDSVHDACPSEYECHRAADRLWERHSAAFRRFEEA